MPGNIEVHTTLWLVERLAERRKSLLHKQMKVHCKDWKKQMSCGYCVSWSWQSYLMILGTINGSFLINHNACNKASQDFRNIRSSMAKKGCQNSFPEYLNQTFKLNFLKAEIGCYICWILTRSLTCKFLRLGENPMSQIHMSEIIA